MRSHERRREAEFVETDAATIAEQFVRARLEGRALQNYPGVVPPDLEAAYRCQEAAIERWPERVGGWKVARIARRLNRAISRKSA